MVKSSYHALLEALYHNEERNFRKIEENKGLPRDKVTSNYNVHSNFYQDDYDLLLKALRKSNKRIVRYLLEKRCHVNRSDKSTAHSTTPLHLAVEKLGWCSIVEKLLKLKASVCAVDANGNTALHWAFIKKSSDKVINLLLHAYVNETSVDIRNDDGLGFMHIACAKADAESLRKFYNAGFTDIHSIVSPVTSPDHAGWAPLHFAVNAGKHDAVTFLCEHEADLYTPDRDSSTPLHLALQKRDIPMIDLLLTFDKEYDNYTNDIGESHFMAACAGSDTTVVLKYIEHFERNMNISGGVLMNDVVKGVPNSRNATYTPLHFACEYGRIHTMRRLLMFGPESEVLPNITVEQLRDITDDQQLLDICEAIKKHYKIPRHKFFDNRNCFKIEETVRYIKKHPSRKNTCLAAAIAAKSIKGSKMLGFSRDRIFLFARTFAVANFPWPFRKVFSKLLNFIMGPNDDCAFCQRFNDKIDPRGGSIV